MLAEIHNKISRDGSNLSERLEDKLTGDFFGTIRYLPFEIGLKKILSAVRFDDPTVNNEWLHRLDKETGFNRDLDFWYRHKEGEIDLLLTLNDSIIGIEVKYLSGLSSEDNDYENKDFQTSSNQLSRYSRLMRDIKGKRKPFLLFIAPFTMVRSVEKDLRKRSIIDPMVYIGFLSWEEILESLEKINSSLLDAGQEIILSDLKKLLIKKGFARYKGIPNDVLNKEISLDTT